MGLWVSGDGQIFNASTQIEASLIHKELAPRQSGVHREILS